jgi:hypothetical protein
MRNVPGSVLEKIKIYILPSVTFFRKLRRLRENVETLCTDGQTNYDNTMRRIRIARWISKARDTHSECLILIAFSLQHWLRERTSILLYTYIACLVYLGEVRAQLHTFILRAQICVQSLPLRLCRSFEVVNLYMGRNFSVKNTMEYIYI